MKKITYIVIMLLISTVVAAQNDAVFDFNGNLIPPDEVYLSKGLKNDKKGYKKTAMKNFTKAALFGNEHAKFFNGLLHMQKEKYIEAYAWLKVVDAEKINRVDKIEMLLEAIETSLSVKDKKSAIAKAAKFKRLYNPIAASLHRESWVSGFEYTGSRIKGNDTTPGTKIFVNADIDVQPDGKIFILGTTVDKSSFEQNLQSFVYNYNYDLPATEVKLKEIELIDD